MTVSHELLQCNIRNGVFCVVRGKGGSTVYVGYSILLRILFCAVNEVGIYLYILVCINFTVV